MAEFNCAVSEGESGAAVLDQSADHPANQLPVSSGIHLTAGHSVPAVVFQSSTTTKIVKQNNENWKEAKTTLHNLNKFWSIDSTSFTKCNTTFAQKHIHS